MKYLDFTRKNRDGSTDGLYVKIFSDGEVLVKILFENWSTSSQTGFQDEVEAWLSQEQVNQLIETLQED